MNLDDAIQTLELSADCTFDDAKKAYRELIQVWHSDRHGHNPKLLERAKQKTQKLNEAWNLISSTGEKLFNERLAAKTSKQEPFKKDSPVNLRSSPKSGVMLVPIWKQLEKKARISKGVRLSVATALLLIGLIRFSSIYERLGVIFLGEQGVAVVETCAGAGQQARMRVNGAKIVRAIPMKLLSLQMTDNGGLTTRCPEQVSVRYLFTRPESAIIETNSWTPLLAPTAELFCFLLLPLAIFYRSWRRRA